MKKSWRTSLAGIIAGVTLLLGQIQTILDDDPKTNPDYTRIVEAVSVIALGLAARDEQVTSEQAGAKK